MDILIFIFAIAALCVIDGQLTDYFQRNKDLYRNYVELVDKSYDISLKHVNQTVDYLKKGEYNKDTLKEMTDKLNSEFVILLQQEKSESYKEGFWNGQKAKIEEVNINENKTE